MTDPDDAQSLNGLDRAITPVAGAATARPGSGRKVAGTVALVALCGGLLQHDIAYVGRPKAFVAVYQAAAAGH